MTHNFIIDHNMQEHHNIANHVDPTPGNVPTEHDFGTLLHRPPNAAEKACAKDKCDQIAQDMWNSYQQLIAE